ncbi:MAG: trehalose-6-phosphate synthase [Thermoanaerobacteraceae bacterium]|nr:trehalose-6-phosphate synthase [Thermoanaerobacteraceae bacterium]
MARLTLQLPSNARMVVVSNRGPFVFEETPGGLRKKEAVSGLVSALLPLFRGVPGIWVAWDGCIASGKEINRAYQEGNLKWLGVPLTQEEVALYYDGFANQVIWPLCHYFIEKCIVNSEWWEGYRAVNQKFAAFSKKASGEADLIWIHDYHLALVPGFLRRRGADGKMPKIGFFWHIPFPGPDTWEVIPWARDIVEGLLGADVIAFHVPGYVENFLSCVASFTDATILPNRRSVLYRGRVIDVRAIPVGVNHELFTALGRDETVREQAGLLRRQIGTEKIFLGVERLDYSKGILERLAAFEYFLEAAPEYHGRVTLVQIGVPTRNGIGPYSDLRRQVEMMVGRINGRFGTPSWTPVQYFYRAFSQRELAAFYLAADVAVVTPLRDGLNLVAAEYVVTRDGGSGVLILSRLAGIAQHLQEALLVNPYNVAETAVAFRRAIEMPASEQQARLEALKQRLARRTANAWVTAFLKVVLEHEVGKASAGY